MKDQKIFVVVFAKENDTALYSQGSDPVDLEG